MRLAGYLDSNVAFAQGSSELPQWKSETTVESQTYYYGSSRSPRRHEEADKSSKCSVPKQGIPPRAAYELLHGEMELDMNTTLNLASFGNTWMPLEARELYIENINKNIADVDQYPAAWNIHNRCVAMIADLWKAPTVDAKPIGTATGGSTEAVLLGGLALKKRWQIARKAAGKDTSNPNVVFGANCQVALEKFARYFDVEARLVPVKASNGYVMDPNDALHYIDENTIGVMVIMGSTYTGHFENVQLMNDLLDDLQSRTGLDIKIHIDAASGGFVAPFCYPNLKWSFELPRVVSINVSGHKFGLVYPGVGWIVWRDESYLHKDLIFVMHYLGGTEYTYTLNLTKPAAPVVAQMFNFLSLGFEGYKAITSEDHRNGRLLSRALEASGYFTVISDIHRPILGQSIADDPNDPENYQPGIPVVTFKFSDVYKRMYPHVQQSWIQLNLRTKGWMVPNYPAPKNEEATEILRVVVRVTLGENLVERLIADIIEVAENLARSGNVLVPTSSGSLSIYQANGTNGHVDEAKCISEVVGAKRE